MNKKIKFIRIQILIFISVLMNGTILYGQYDQEFIRKNKIKSIFLIKIDRQVLFPGEIIISNWGHSKYVFNNPDSSKPKKIDVERSIGQITFDKNGYKAWDLDFKAKDKKEAIKVINLNKYNSIGLIDENGLIKQIFYKEYLVNKIYKIKTLKYDSSNRIISEVDSVLENEPYDYLDSIKTKNGKYDLYRKIDYKTNDTILDEIIKYKYDLLGRLIEKNSSKKVLLYNYDSIGFIKKRITVSKENYYNAYSGQWVKIGDTNIIQYSSFHKENFLLETFLSDIPEKGWLWNDFTCKEIPSKNLHIKQLLYGNKYVKSYYNRSGNVKRIKILFYTSPGTGKLPPKKCYNAYFKYNKGLVNKVKIKIPKENVDKLFKDKDIDEIIFNNKERIKKWYPISKTRLIYRFYKN
jgi:YD repeat-containing protein